MATSPRVTTMILALSSIIISTVNGTSGASLSASAPPTSTSYLRRRKVLFDHSTSKGATMADEMNTKTKVELRKLQHQQPVTRLTTSVDSTTPSLMLSKFVYAEGEPIALSFRLGSPHDEYYTSRQSLDFADPAETWTVGLFMRDADPQGGALTPIVSLSLCGDDAACRGGGGGIDNKDVRGTVLFGGAGDEQQVVAQDQNGQWPLRVGDYGTGYDAYVLDGQGAAAIGPLQFQILEESELNEQGMSAYDGNNNNNVYPPPPPTETKNNKNKNTTTTSGKKKERLHGLKHYDHTHTQKSVTSSHSSAATNETPKTIHKSTLGTSKSEYREAEPVTVTFAFQSDVTSHYSDEDLAEWSVGIYMRMARPQGGSLSPVVSLPLCGITNNDNAAASSSASSSYCNAADVSSHGGELIFGGEGTMTIMEGTWPINLLDYGTGYDVYVLNGSGEGMLGPVKFNIIADEMRR